LRGIISIRDLACAIEITPSDHPGIEAFRHHEEIRVCVPGRSNSEFASLQGSAGIAAGNTAIGLLQARQFMAPKRLACTFVPLSKGRNAYSEKS
jgi:hypothetical protein